MACGVNSRLRSSYSVLPTRFDAAPRQPVHKPGHTRGRWCVLAGGGSVLYRRGGCKPSSTSTSTISPGSPGPTRRPTRALSRFASTARRAIALRESVYRATDIDNFDGEGIAFPSRYALRFGSTRHSQDEARLPEVRAAFNSPFWPFVLATTSVGQEGIDFHWWCHSVVHWNIPANPVDFEQREGRVDRYKGHAIRKNVAAAHRSAALVKGVTDPWKTLFEAAAAEDDHGLGGLTPFWIYPGDAQLQRRIMALPLSRDQERWAQLQESLALYRLAFGQPRQEDMLAALQRRGIAGRPERMAEIRIDLRPPPPRAVF